MTVRRMAGGLLIAITFALLLAPVALADTCCANTSVLLEPTMAEPGDTIRLSGIQCLNYDNSGPLPLNLKRFWLSASTLAANPNPGDTPGPGMPADVPPVEQWLAFKSVPDPNGSGSATIVVPAIPRGSYQLWWLCDNDGGPGSGIHYSGGPRLEVGAGLPNTATIDPQVPVRAPLLLLLFVGFGVSLVLLRVTSRASRRQR